MNGAARRAIKVRVKAISSFASSDWLQCESSANTSILNRSSQLQVVCLSTSRWRCSGPFTLNFVKYGLLDP